MAINSTDIKLLESERMSDASDGGGRKTSRVIVDGLPGNIFPKVSRLDSVYGRVNLRKVYGTVQTANTDTYAGAHATVMDAPNNDRIHVSLFSTGSDYDTRSAARDRIESFVVAGPESRMTLYAVQLQGQQALLAYQRPEESLPEVGQVLCLSTETGGVVAHQQFVRITGFTDEVRTFTDTVNGASTFTMRVLSLQLSSPLRYTFNGPETPSRFSAVAKSTLIRGTTVADTARYFGVKKLFESAPANALSLRVSSVYSPIVPTTQRETAISLASISGSTGSLVAGGYHYGGDIYMNGNVDSTRLFFGKPIIPGTLQSGYNVGRTWIDDAEGNYREIYNATTGASWWFDVNYEQGYLAPRPAAQGGPGFDGGASWSSYGIRYSIGVNVDQPARTMELPVTLATRGTVQALSLIPPPTPQSVIVDYRALGKWYRLRDNGNGVLSGGDAAYGIGSVDYATGALLVTLGALPDVDSSILMSWGSPEDYTARWADANDAFPYLKHKFTLENVPVKRSSFSYTFHSIAGDLVGETATANAAGVISGAGVSGKLNHETGEVEVWFTAHVPDPSTSSTATYQKVIPVDAGNPTLVTGTLTGMVNTTLAKTDIVPGSFSITAPVAWSSHGSYDTTYAAWFDLATVTITDDGAGALVAAVGQVIGASAWASNIIVVQLTVVGSINYATGELVFNNPYLRSRMVSSNGSWSSRDFDAVLSTTLACSFKYSQNQAGTTASSFSEDIPASLTVDLTSTTHDVVVPGSVMFSIVTVNGSNRTYHMFQDSEGMIRGMPTPQTGASTQYGTINYTTGEVTLTGGFIPNYPNYLLQINGCLTKKGNFTVTSSFFRTAGSPLRSGSTYIQVTSLTGELLSGSCDSNGTITGTGMRGTVVQDMGIIRVEFGTMVDTVWVPTPVFPSTLRYSTVVLSNLPLNADILGLDPVRLPSDGRVPIYRPADVVVIHNTKTLTLANPAVAGATYSVGRTTLSDLWLVDASGIRVPTTKYTVNLAAGTVTMAADLSLTGYIQPLVAHHRIEEMQLLSDVQINGLLSITSPLSREYDADTLVSSALLFGDLSAKYTNLFDQNTWTGVWSDTVIGGGATAQYNDIDYPIEVLNNGAVTDQWRINFTSTTAFQVISTNLGVIATGSTAGDCSPVNALTGNPYFVIRAAGWGLGWSVGNQLRFNTNAAGAPIWIARTVLPGATLEGDSFDAQMRGDVD